MGSPVYSYSTAEHMQEPLVILSKLIEEVSEGGVVQYWLSGEGDCFKRQ